MAIVLECNNLSKTYGKVKAVQDISLKLEENKIYGLLGRNGAGKTTLLNLLCSQIIRDSGEVKVFKEEVFENASALEKLCFVKERDLPIADYKVNRIFKAASMLYPNWDEEYKKYLIKEFKIDIKKKYKNLSRGNKTLVNVIIGLASRAAITIFDEPSLGLDAAVREKFYNLLLQDYENNKRTIVISTHLIDEVSSLFEEIIILNNGQLQVQEELAILLEKAYFLSGREENILPFLKDKKIIHKEFFGATAIVGVFGKLSESEIRELKLKNIEVSSMPLQKLFIYITEKALI
ncbi:ABC transporter ATP-binding protein [Clostridium sp. SYSU_GA19001]|uniref:ATP-binding cassette domain-containing protein n=1 Tax=Clostridium caldaquaticum TaxID=2940653 RepID=UPI0020778AC1|nr:ABC transporter ATP-binding protein [Clostridium caldaquaticum]MCM8710287.1 ABC transporter ATP-binding protein [Clostridium caldaquaticum]